MLLSSFLPQHWTQLSAAHSKCLQSTIIQGVNLSSICLHLSSFFPPNSSFPFFHFTPPLLPFTPSPPPLHSLPSSPSLPSLLPFTPSPTPLHSLPSSPSLPPLLSLTFLTWNMVSELRDGKRGTKYFRHSSFPNRGVSRLISYREREHQEGTLGNQTFVARTYEYITFFHLAH